MDEPYCLYGILYECSFKERLNDCPLNKFDKLSFQKKLLVFKALTEEEKQDILIHHKACVKKRERHSVLSFNKPPRF
jgi:hypothetical protein